jgi:hypothetical protein
MSAGAAIPWAARLLTSALKVGPRVGKAAKMGIKGLNYAKAHPFRTAASAGGWGLSGLGTVGMVDSLFGGGGGPEADQMKDFYLDQMDHEGRQIGRQETQEWMLNGMMDGMRSAPYQQSDGEAREAALEELVQKHAVRLGGVAQTKSSRPDLMEMAMRMGYA